MRTNVATASPDTTGLKIASGAGMPSVRQLSGNRGDPQARLGASPCSVPARRHPQPRFGQLLREMSGSRRALLGHLETVDQE
jgi:hypothetical protein